MMVPAAWELVRSSAALVALLLAACAEGRYQLPYVYGEDVRVLKDAVTHATPAPRMYDMVAVSTGSGVSLTAAAPGWIRFIEDSNTESGKGNNNFVWIEHPYPYCQDPNDRERATWPGKPANYDATCTPCRRLYCNEWTVYAHMRPNSVRGATAAGRSEGDWVEAGDLIGFEGDIGQAHDGRGNPVQHLHWHVARISPAWKPNPNGDYEGKFGQGPRPELIPWVCTQAGLQVLARNQVYRAAPCQ